MIAFLFSGVVTIVCWFSLGVADWIVLLCTGSRFCGVTGDVKMNSENPS